MNDKKLVLNKKGMGKMIFAGITELEQQGGLQSENQGIIEGYA